MERYYQSNMLRKIVRIFLSILVFVNTLLQHIVFWIFSKDSLCSPCLEFFRYIEQMEPTYHIVREVHIAYHHYSTGASHLLIRIGPEKYRGSQLRPLQSTLFREIVTEDLSFYAFEEEPIIHVKLRCPENVLSHEQATIEGRLKKEEETCFVFLLNTASTSAYHLGLAISYV